MNSRCPIAARLADTLALIEANSGVIVVPMLLPRISAAAMSKVIHPLLHMMSEMASVALDACTIMVTMAPTAQNIKMERNPIWV